MRNSDDHVFLFPEIIKKAPWFSMELFPFFCCEKEYYKLIFGFNLRFTFFIDICTFIYIKVSIFIELRLSFCTFVYI